MTRMLLLVALAAMLGLSGCAKFSRGRSAPRPSVYGAVTTAGLKPVSQVEPCCADMAAGRIPFPECYNKPACKAKGNICCMNAVKDLPPPRP